MAYREDVFLGEGVLSGCIECVCIEKAYREGVQRRRTASVYRGGVSDRVTLGHTRLAMEYSMSFASRYSPWAINVLANSDVREKGGDWGCR